LCLKGGFARLTDLIYMFRLCDSDWPLEDYDLTEPMRWVHYEPRRHEQFKEVVARTYEGSLDCPELEGLRDMEDVLRAHKGSGDFDEQLWKLLMRDEEPVGVLLLRRSLSGHSLELVYMGLVPDLRRRGLGPAMLTEALRCGRDGGAEFVALGVDCRNHPAYRLYKSFGFNVLQRRIVLYRTI